MADFACLPVCRGPTTPNARLGATTTLTPGGRCGYRYRMQYRMNPRHDYSVDPRQDGAWKQRDAEAAAGRLQPKPFVGRSVYQADILHAADGAASIPAAPASPPAPPLPPIKPGYLTTNTAAWLPVHEACVAAAAARRAGYDASTDLPRCASTPASPAPYTAAPHFDGSTTHQQNFSGRVRDELNMGTAKQSRHPPGRRAGCGQVRVQQRSAAHVWSHRPSPAEPTPAPNPNRCPPLLALPWLCAGCCGHVPSSPDLVAAAGLGPRPPREQAQLYHLDQHPHGRVPGYTGHKTGSLDLPPPTRKTTSGWAAHQVASRAGPAVRSPHGITKGLQVRGTAEKEPPTARGHGMIGTGAASSALAGRVSVRREGGVSPRPHSCTPPAELLQQWRGGPHQREWAAGG